MSIATLTRVKAVSLLPNSSSEILQPMALGDATLQVEWIEAIDAHGLFFQSAPELGVLLLATHHNGYSCHALAKRLIEGNRDRAVLQLEYIKACGGTGIDKAFLPIS